MKGSRRLDWEAARSRLEQSSAPQSNNEQWQARRRTMLEARAALLAQPLIPRQTQSQEVMVFRLGAEFLAFPLTGIEEVVFKPRIAPAPGAPEGVAGLIQRSGDIFVVWNLSRILSLPPEQNIATSSVLLLRGKARIFGVLVGEVEGVRSIPQEQRHSTSLPHALWVTDDYLTALDPETLLTHKQTGTLRG